MQYVPKYENKVQYIVNLIKDIKNINILELGVREGISTKEFLEVCKKNNGNLTSIDIEDCSNVSDDPNWKFIHSSDDNFELIDKQVQKNLNFIYIDSYHEPSHVEKVFYHYYDFLKINGICVIDDISWLPYCKKEYRDNEFSEIINRSVFSKILEIYNQNKDKFSLEFYFEGSGLAIIKKKNSDLHQSKEIISRERSIKNILKYFLRRKPKK
jgi:predicted O-methyltransferase YrrM